MGLPRFFESVQGVLQERLAGFDGASHRTSQLKHCHKKSSMLHPYGYPVSLRFYAGTASSVALQSKEKIMKIAKTMFAVALLQAALSCPSLAAA